jgi:hypothetical protein
MLNGAQGKPNHQRERMDHKKGHEGYGTFNSPF